MFDPIWTTRPFLPLATDRLVLRPFRDEDAPTMAFLLNDIKVVKTLKHVPHPYSIEDAHDYIRLSREKFSEGQWVVLAITDRKTGEMIGCCSLRPEPGLWIAPQYWGQGFGREAMRSLLHFGFSALEIPRMEVSVLESNKASRRIFEGLGFEKLRDKPLTSTATGETHPGLLYELSRQDYFKAFLAKKVPLVWVVAAALINEKGQLLLAQRPEGKSMAGVWELPGGKIEIGESPEEALLRELKEELDIDVCMEDLHPLTFASYRYDTFHLAMPFFICRRWKGEPQGMEGQALKWVMYEDLEGVPTPAADIALFHRLASELKDQGVWSVL